MSRLVPATPRSGRDAVERILLALEKSLPDTTLLIQNRPFPDMMTVINSLFGVAVVLVADGEAQWDPDAGWWSSASHVQALEGARALLSDAAVRGCEPFAVVCFPDSKAPAVAHPGAPTSLAGPDCVDELGETLIVKGMMTSSALTDAQMEALLQVVAPGAMPWGNHISPAQAEWRSRRGQAPKTTFRSTPAAELRVDQAGQEATVTASSLATKRNGHLWGPELTEDDPLLVLISKVISVTVGERPLLASRMKVSTRMAAGVTDFLPAILVSAAEDWAAVVAAGKGKGGFHIRLKSVPAPASLFGYQVTGIHASSPLILSLAVMDVVRRLRVKDCYHLDLCATRFKRFLMRNGLPCDAMAEIEGDLTSRLFGGPDKFEEAS